MSDILFLGGPWHDQYLPMPDPPPETFPVSSVDHDGLEFRETVTDYRLRRLTRHGPMPPGVMVEVGVAYVAPDYDGPPRC